MKPRHRARTRTGEVLSEGERRLRSLSTQKLRAGLEGCSVAIGYRIFGIPPSNSSETREYVLRTAERSCEMGLEMLLHGAADFESEYVRRGLDLPDVGAVQEIVNRYVAAQFVFATTNPGPESEVVH